MSTILDKGVSLNEARDWFSEQRDSDEGYPELTCDANIIWQDGRESTITLCVTWSDEPDWHIWVQMQICPDDDEEEPEGTLLDIALAHAPWTLDAVCQMFRIDPDSPIWTREMGG